MTPDSESERVPLASERLSRLESRLDAAPGLLLCLDFDGTLAPIVPDPDAAEMAPGNADLIRRLRSTPGVEVGVVSGRALADLRERVGVDGVHYVGNHGLERVVDGERSVLPEADALTPELDRVVETLRTALADVPGAVVEDKDVTATIHYRQVPDDRIEAVRTTVADAVDPVDDLRRSDGKQIVEIRPDVEAGKDRAVRRLRELVPDHLPAFVGDDVTDEDAFRELSADGVAIHVGDREDTAASLRVRDPAGVTALLDWLADACEDRFGATPTDG